MAPPSAHCSSGKPCKVEIVSINTTSLQLFMLCMTSKKVGTERDWKCKSCASENSSNTSNKMGEEIQADPALDVIASFCLESGENWKGTSKLELVPERN
ncbi:hypothetical protein J6590_076926 [Homalodisca vitripennis]|nr:hypothetical protein J6590_076926 [Homalodisca vitripennis]